MKLRAPRPVTFPPAVLAIMMGICFLSGPATAQDQEFKIGPGEPAAPQALPPAAPQYAAVVPYEKMLPFLPEPPEGWSAETATGSTNETENLKLSTVHRSYYKGDGDVIPAASITIIDAAGNMDYYAATTAAWRVSSETPDGYDRGVQIDGRPGFEHYDKTRKSSSLSVFLNKRYYIQVELTNVDPADLREWYKRIDVKKLLDIK